MKGKCCFHFAMSIILGCNIFSVHMTKETQQSVDKSISNFSVDIMKAIAKEKTEGKKIHKNILMSPTNIFRALLLVYAATASSSKVQLEKALHMKDVSADAIRNYLAETQKPQGTLKEAAKLFVDTSIVVKKPYEDIVSKSLNKVDMKGDPTKLRQDVNNLVNNLTDGMISEVLPKTWRPNGQSIFISAIYFKSSWRHLFRKQLTKPGQFTTNKGNQVTTPMMQNQLRYPYFDSTSLQCKVLGMEYTDKSYTMLVFLPKEKGTQTVETLISQLTPSLITDTYNSLKVQQVQLSFPKFKSNTEINLKSILSQLGVTDAFTPKADFSFMTGTKMQLSEAIHHAKINLDEDGTEAAAYTLLGGLGSSPNKTPPVPFIANRPFLYMIYNTDKHIPVFMGLMVDPTQK